MIEQHDSEEYNYSVFEGKEDFAGFRTLLQVGSMAPDFPATLLLVLTRKDGVSKVEITSSVTYLLVQKQRD